MKATYLSCAETSKLVRAALKRAFPGTKFSVRSDTYSMGASIRVKWTDGPTLKMVESVAKQFAGGDFDGMIDMKISKDHWLLPDGTAAVARCPGTEGSRGVIPAQREWMPHPDARLVSFGADFVFCDRKMSTAFAERVVEKARAAGADLDGVRIVTSGYDGSAHFHCQYMEKHDVLHRIASRLVIARAAV